MHLGKACPRYPKEAFKGGITNGANWYLVKGGMQDYNYVHSNCFELTIEVGCFKYPNHTELSKFWIQNRAPLIAFMEQVFILMYIFKLHSNKNYKIKND